MTQPPAIWRLAQKFPKLLGRKATVISYSRVCNGPKNMVHRIPYYVALIRFHKSKEKMTVEICHEGEDNITTGANVILVSRKYRVSEKGLIQYILKGKIFHDS